ncbi:hypothetical protein LMG26690_03581 [Achromobacter animicus]|uniref:Uncharacterized protein n=1 Tax=Achromobacter animicus TaxID=1389935 RepID=A0A6S7BJC2_9BURK|nr:hypothetical protein [Achromobacter animicus]CAB3716881.1 hypothetical protein LMG26690_03581 [Achromobacter animicus]
MMMTIWALIQEGRVTETTSIDPAGRFHPEFKWVEAHAGVQEGYLYESGKFAAPEVPAVAKSVFSPREYMKRFAVEEQIRIRKAQLTDMEVGLVYDDFNRAGIINVEDPHIAAGLDLYIAKGLLVPERRAELLRPAGPDDVSS